MNTAAGAERRRFPRVVGSTYELECGREHAVRVLDVSAGGVLFESFKPLTVGARVGVKIRGRGFADATMLEVKRCTPTPYRRGEVVHQIGGQFHPPVDPAIADAASQRGFLAKTTSQGH